MRRFLPILSVWASLALIAVAAAPMPTPSPTPSPAARTSPAPRSSATASPRTSSLPSPTLPALASPTILIYPFDAQSGLDPKVGAAIADILSQQMTAAGGVNVLPIPKNVPRAQFLEYASKQHADFYVSGYIMPVGSAASVVQQVVSVDSGVILFSQTAQVFSVADVASQGLLARSQMLAFFGRGTQNIQSQSSKTPAPTSTNGAQVKIGGIGSVVDSLFHRRGGPTPAPTPVSKPSRGVIVAPVSAAAGFSAADLSNATNELYFALNRNYNASITTVKSNIATAADSICGTRRNNTIAAGTLAPKDKKNPQVVFTMQVYTCFGAVLYTQTGKGNTFKSAIDAAAAAYATAHPDNS